MKKKILTLFIILLTACNPSSLPTERVALTVSVDSIPILSPIGKQQINTFISPDNKPTMTSVIKLQPIPSGETRTLIPEVQPKLYSFIAQSNLTSLTYQEYNPKDWELIPGSFHISDTLVVLDPTHRLWQTDGHNLIYFDGKDWGKITRDEINYDQLSLASMSPDGTLWLEGRRTGRRDLIRYKNDQIVSYRIPDVTDRDTDHVVLTSDHKQGVWVSIYEEGHAPKHLFHFDGLDWQEYPLPFRSNWVCCSVGLVADSMGYLWLNTYDYVGFARLDGKNWQEYKENVFWTPGANPAKDRILLAPGPDGSMWALMTYHPTIYRFYPDGKIDKINQSFMGDDFGFAIDIFVDSRNYLWMSSLDASGAIAPLVYWDGHHWNTFSHLPFKQVNTILNQEGRLLIQTESGWYWYTPKR